MENIIQVPPVSAKEGKVALYDYGMILVNEIEQAHDTLWETSTNSDDDEETLKSRSAGIYAEVCQELTEGKPTYSNDGARKAAASYNESRDPLVRELKSKIRSNARLKSAGVARIEALNNRLKLVNAFLRGGE